MDEIDCKAFSDSERFMHAALPLLQHDLTLNTMCLSEAALLCSNSNGVYMAIFRCKGCSTEHSCVVLSAGNTGNTYKLMVSESVCQPMAEYMKQQLQQQAFTSITAVGRVADLLADGLGFTSRHVSDIMVLPSSPGTVLHPAAHADATTADPNSHKPGSEPGHPTANSQHSSSLPVEHGDIANSTGQPTTADRAAAAPEPAVAGDMSITITLLSKDSDPDVSLIYDWSSKFVQSAMKSNTLPPKSMIDSFVLPWLNHGQYELAVRSDEEPVCMLCHVPTSDVSCRIVWVYTLPEHRQQGYARKAVAELCKKLKQKYQHICLLVNQDNHAARRVYQDTGFITVDQLVLACKPDHPFGYAVQQQHPVAGASAEASET